jgi:hypothetical protein
MPYMRSVLAVLSVFAMITGQGIGAAPPARASNTGSELNGTFLVSSNGQWAKTNDVLMNESSSLQTWTVTSSCASPIECTGTVKSDQGWTGTLRLDKFYYVEHDIPNWAPCPDGTFADGHQMFLMWGIDPNTEEGVSTDIHYLGARNVTRTASGSCGANKPLIVEMPAFVKQVS